MRVKRVKLLMVKGRMTLRSQSRIVKMRHAKAGRSEFMMDTHGKKGFVPFDLI